MSDEHDEIAVVEIEDSIDLHGFQPRDIPDVVVSYLEAALEKGFAEVRLIHGKGTGVQRKRVRAVLDRLDYVLDYPNPPENRGGFGATLVRLDLLRR
ncbi:MAG TPA: Smr/MutS family protein [Polyangiaceae bacterium]|nr:Smr/MutS family protein [Polyangiaceae bacterium]